MWNGLGWMVVVVIRNPQDESKFISPTCSIPRHRWKKNRTFCVQSHWQNPLKKTTIFLGAEILGESCELGFHEFFETLERNSSGIRTNNMDKWMFSTLRRWRPHLIIASSLIDGRTKPQCIWLFLFQPAKSMSGSSWFIHFTVALMMSPTAAKARRQISLAHKRKKREWLRVARNDIRTIPHDSR